MPSNKQYADQANELAKELGIPIVTKGMSNIKLGELVSDLLAKKTDANTITQADAPAPPPPPAEADDADAQAKVDADAQAKVDADAQVEIFPYCIAPGKAITSRKGVLSDGDEIKAEYVAGGEDTLADLVKKGFVIKA